MEGGSKARSENFKFDESVTTGLNCSILNAAFFQADRDKMRVGKLFVDYVDKNEFRNLG